MDENPLVNRVVFEGNKEVTSGDLAKEVQIKARQPLVRARVQAEVQRILDLYRRQGYYAAQVDPKLIELDHKRSDLVFEIREGPETKVAGINFIGNRSFSASELRGAISTTETGLLDFLEVRHGLRSGPHQRGPGAVAPLLSEERLRGYARAFGGRRRR